jgi:hypothetical protein
MVELATMPGLTGPLPKELCTITSLRRLCICRCGLNGPIPSEIGQLIHLEELQLFGNNFTGKIPSSLGNLVHLKLLSLGEYTGGNHFDQQTLPSCVSKLVALEALFLANCNITGTIPSWVGELKGKAPPPPAFYRLSFLISFTLYLSAELRQLDLQRNLLHGNLPKAIGKLENLLYLNVKDNIGLGGRLPLAELLCLTKLNRLSLVHCDFHDTDIVMEAMKIALPRCKIWI